MKAAALRQSVFAEGLRDDAAAILLAQALSWRTPEELPDDQLVTLIDTARAQRDLELAERLAVEREQRATRKGEALERADARFDLARLKASRGKFAEAASWFQGLVDGPPLPARAQRSPSDHGPGTPGFLPRARFNLGAMLEKQGDLEGASREFIRVEQGKVGPANLAALQRARLEIRRGGRARALEILLRPALAGETGRVEVLLLLVCRSAELGDLPVAARALAEAEALQKQKRLADPWKTELPFWQGRVAEARGDLVAAAGFYSRILTTIPSSLAADLARARLLALEPAARDLVLQRLRTEGEALLSGGKPREAMGKLLPGAQLGDLAARSLLRVAYSRLPGYAEILLLPDLPEQALPDLCGDAGACRLLQLGLPKDAEPIVRDVLRLDTALGAILAARLAEGADAGPAALEAADALDRQVPADLLLDLAPQSVVRALSPRPFASIVAATAAELDVPEDLLYAVMRQESRFDREAVSPAAARGLMQLTLPAAGEAARELSEEPPAYTELYDPVRSVRLGARMLRTLLDRFGDEAAIVAGYNAGAGQTFLWIAGGAEPAPSLLASVSYTETRNYLRRVLRNRNRYRAVLGGSGATEGAPSSGSRR